MGVISNRTETSCLPLIWSGFEPSPEQADSNIYQQASLRWRHNDHPGVSNHQPHGCLLNRLFRRRWKKTSKLRVTGLCAGNSPVPVNSPHKGPVTRKMFPFDDVIMMFYTLHGISRKYFLWDIDAPIGLYLGVRHRPVDLLEGCRWKNLSHPSTRHENSQFLND